MLAVKSADGVIDEAWKFSDFLFIIKAMKSIRHSKQAVMGI